MKSYSPHSFALKGSLRKRGISKHFKAPNLETNVSKLKEEMGASYMQKHNLFLVSLVDYFSDMGRILGLLFPTWILIYLCCADSSTS